jgi:hypothetical protein
MLTNIQFSFFMEEEALEFEFRASCLLGSWVPLEPLCQYFFVMVFFKTGPLELFALAGLKP